VPDMRPMARVGLAVMGFMLRGCKKIVKDGHGRNIEKIRGLRASGMAN
jgi:hypothetical protein